MALKIQYPGIGESIDSDVDNVSALLTMTGLIPKSMDVSELLNEAKKQLHAEANYQQEADYLKQFTQLMQDDPRFLIPDIYDDLTCETILAMRFVEGIEIEQLAKQPQAVRDEVMTLAFTLLFKEVFEFRLVQTDPNFANYRYNPDTQQFILLDFGATRAYPEQVSEGYRQLMSGAVAKDRATMLAALKQIGFFHQPIEAVAQQAVIDLCLEACEPLAFNGDYDFGVTDMGRRIRDAGSALSMNKGYWHTPPADAIFLHRKLGGLYLLAAKLKARVNVYQLFQPYILATNK